MEIDRLDPEILEALRRRGKRYKKLGQVRARQAKRRTLIETVLPDGAKETRNVAEPGDYIVTGQGGERYVVKPATFEARYSLKPGAKTVYLACGEVIAVPNPFGRPISVMASWGERMLGAADCMIADAVGPGRKRRAGDPYIIARPQFEETYERTKAPKKR